jgi:hypothetical protein
MLPGFRFLFTAIILSMSVLIFGLGAAALLRAAHEEFANLPARRTAPAPMFARQIDDQPPTLALLRIDTSADEKPAENAPAPAAPEAAADAPAQVAQSVSPMEPEKLAAVRPAEPMQAEAARLEAPTSDTPAPVAAEAAASEVKLAAVVEASQAAVAEGLQPAVASAPPAADIYSFEGNPAATRIATLGGPAVIVDEKAAAEASEKTEGKTTTETKAAEAKPTEAKPDRNAAKKRAAEQAREKRRIAAARRARQAREAALTLQQQQPNPFIQTPFAQGPVARATR